MHALQKYLVGLVVGPLLVVTTLLLLLTQGLHQFPLAVSQEDTGFDMPAAGHVNIPESLAKTLDANVFALHPAKTAAEAQALFDSGSVKAMLSFPPGLSEDVFIKQDDSTYVFPAKIKLQVVGDNPLLKLAVVASLAKGFVPVIAQSGSFSADSLPIPIDLGALIDGFANAEPFMFATLFALLVSVLTGLFSLFATKARAKTGLLDPKKGASTALAHIVSFAVAGSVLYLSLLSITYWLLALPFTAGMFWASLVLFVFFWACAGLGQAAGSNVPERSIAIVPFLILPLFLGGIFAPVELLPTWFQWIEFIFPAHYALAAATNVEFAKLPSFGWDLGLLFLFALIFTGGSIHGLTQTHKEKSA